MRTSLIFLAIIISVVIGNIQITQNGTTVEYPSVTYVFRRGAKTEFNSFNASLVVPGEGVIIAGKAVLAKYPDDRKKYLQWEKQGVVGIVEYYEASDDLRVGGGNFIKINDLSDLRVVVIGQRHVSHIEENTTVTFIHSENRWYTVYESFWSIARHIFVAFITGIALFIACYRYYQFVSIEGFSLSIPKVALLIEIVSCAFRLAWCIPEPNGYLFLLPGWYDEVGRTFHTIGANISNLLIVLYWHESMISMSLNVTPFVKKLAIPFYVTSLVLVLFETILNILRIVLFPIPPYSFYISAAFHAAVNGTVMVYLTVIALKLWQRLRRSGAAIGGSKGSVRRLFLRVAFSLFFMANIAKLAMFWIFWPIWQSNPIAHSIYYIEFMVMFNGLSITQSLSFLPPKPTSTKSNSYSFKTGSVNSTVNSTT